jgi:FkbM family methyltransferase
MLLREIARTTFASMLHKLTTVKVGHRIADSRFAAKVCGSGAVIAKLHFGAQAVVFADEYVGRAAYLWGDNDPRLTAIIESILREGDTALDIGANFGLPGLLVAKIVGPSGVVHLVEPQPIAASCLRASLLINGYSNSHVHECALTDHTGSATMSIADRSDMSTAAILSPEQQLNPPSRTIRVRTENAGEFIAALGCKKVALIKIDVEGYEFAILTSMREWLAANRPPVILFECHLNGHPFREQPSVRLLSELNYQFLSVDTRPVWQTRLNTMTNKDYATGRDFVAVLWDELDQDRRSSLESLIARSV